MKTYLTATIVAFSAFLSPADAGDVVVKDVHLCCGACVKAVNKVLPDAEVDRDAKTVTMAAADAEAAKKALKTLTDAGFGGVATFDGKPMALPESGVKEGQKADSVTFSDVHLCCGGCVKAAEKAVADLGDVTIDRKAKTVTVSGGNVDVPKVYAALVKAGFFGKVKS